MSLQEKGARDLDAETLRRHRGGDRVKVEAETGVRRPQDEEHQGLLATPSSQERDMRRILLQSLQREHGPPGTLTLDFQTLELWESKFTLSHSVCSSSPSKLVHHLASSNK